MSIVFSFYSYHFQILLGSTPVLYAVHLSPCKLSYIFPQLHVIVLMSQSSDLVEYRIEMFQCQHWIISFYQINFPGFVFQRKLIQRGLIQLEIEILVPFLRVKRDQRATFQALGRKLKLLHRGWGVEVEEAQLIYRLIFCSF